MSPVSLSPFRRLRAVTVVKGVNELLLCRRPAEDSAVEIVFRHLLKGLVGSPTVLSYSIDGGERARAMPPALAMNIDGPVGMVVDEA